MRPATEDEIARWDELIAANPDGGQVLQTFTWGEFKGRHGWAPKYFVADNLAVLFLARKIPFYGELLYCPAGPGVATADQLASIVAQASQAPAFLLQFDPPLPKGNLSISGLVKAPHDIQLGTTTVIVNLGPSEDEIIGSFKQKTRYNIRYAQKHEVTISPVDATDENLRLMYELMQSTQGRAGFYLRPFEYFADYWRTQSEAGQGKVFFARHDDQVLAGAFVQYFSDKATYKDGGSTREHANLQAPYLLQWEIMRWLKDKGVKYYDLQGVPPAGSGPNHPLSSLVQFKTGFNDVVTEYAGVYDLPLVGWKYKLWRAGGEKLYSKYLAIFEKTQLY